MKLEISEELKAPLVQLLLAIADDKLMLGHLASDWTGLAPILEEDIAFSAISQEEIAHAAELYQIVAALSGERPDAVAFGRNIEEYRCALLVTLQDEFNWARAMVRHFLCDHLDILRFGRLARSSVAPLAALARRIHAEERVHVDHADVWMEHLGQGGDEAKHHMQSALDVLAPYAGMLFEETEGAHLLEEAGVYPRDTQPSYDQWLTDVHGVVAGAGLRIHVDRPPPDAVGGRRGRHGTGFAAVLDEMCEVFRVEPEAAW